MRYDLFRLGIHASSLFPDVDGLAARLMWQHFVLPHDAPVQQRDGQRPVDQHSAAQRSNIVPMRVTTGKVIEGKVVVEGLPLEEGAVVTVLAREAEETFRLSPEEEAELLLSIEEADRGETVSLEEVLEKLPGPRS